MINFDKQLSDQKTQHLWFFACQKASLHLGFSSWELNICYARPPKVLLLLQTYVQVQLTVQTPNFSITLTFLFHTSTIGSIVLPILNISSEFWLQKCNLQVVKYKYLLLCRFVQSGTIGNIIIFPTNFPKYFRQRYISAPCCLKRIVGG